MRDPLRLYAKMSMPLMDKGLAIEDPRMRFS
jgi:hypothetical protein